MTKVTTKLLGQLLLQSILDNDDNVTNFEVHNLVLLITIIEKMIEHTIWMVSNHFIT
jgi:hypothetical protein